jgi:hypothetical protein
MSPPAKREAFLVIEGAASRQGELETESVTLTPVM